VTEFEEASVLILPGPPTGLKTRSSKVGGLTAIRHLSHQSEELDLFTKTKAAYHECHRDSGPTIPTLPQEAMQAPGPGSIIAYLGDQSQTRFRLDHVPNAKAWLTCVLNVINSL